MAESKLFSVVIPSYGHSGLWKDAINSVLMQDYPAIELIFSDDGTVDFDIEQIRSYIDENRRENLIRYNAVTLSKNVGTVQNLRNAHKLCTGEYLTHMAADDAYCATDVLSRYACALEDASADILGVYAKSIICDEELKSTGKCSFDTAQAVRMNSMDADGQFAKFAYNCCAHMGATAFKREKFLAAGDFDDQFKLLDDWPCYVNGTLRGHRFKFIDFDAIFYRDGGVTDVSFSSPIKRILVEDHLKLYEKLILPHIKKLPLYIWIWIFGKYTTDRNLFEEKCGPIRRKENHETLKKYGFHWIHHLPFWLLKRHMKKTIAFISGCIICWMIGRADVATVYLSGLSIAILFVQHRKRQRRK